MRRSKPVVRLLLALPIAALAAATALSFLGRLHWMPELLTHFRVQLAVAAALLAVAAAGLRAHRAAAVAALCLLAHAAPLAPYLLPRAAPAELAAVPLRVLLLNVLTVNERHDAVAGLLWKEDPDVVGLLEIDDRWNRALAPIRARYPHAIDRPQSDNFGIALWSRVPVEHLELRRLEHPAIHAAIAELAIGGRRTILLLVHPAPPAGGRLASLRDRQLDAIAQIRNEFPDREAIVLGDLNTSPASPRHARLEESAGVANAARGIGWLASWPTSVWWLRTPIDHCLLSPGLRAAALRLGPHVGSDHLPLIVEIAPAEGTVAVR